MSTLNVFLMVSGLTPSLPEFNLQKIEKSMPDREKLSRRNFVKGAIQLSLAGAATLAGCAPGENGGEESTNATEVSTASTPTTLSTPTAESHTPTSEPTLTPESTPTPDGMVRVQLIDGSIFQFDSRVLDNLPPLPEDLIARKMSVTFDGVISTKEMVTGVMSRVGTERNSWYFVYQNPEGEWVEALLQPDPTEEFPLHVLDGQGQEVTELGGWDSQDSLFIEGGLVLKDASVIRVGEPMTVFVVTSPESPLDRYTRLQRTSQELGYPILLIITSVFYETSSNVATSS